MEELKRDSGLSPEVIIHKPVMVREVLSFFAMLQNSSPLVLDCTLGAGGHAQAMLDASPAASYIGIDADPEALERSSRRLSTFSERLSLKEGFFDEVLASLSETAKADTKFRKPDFILFDLGLSSHQYLGSGRGFSFSADERLDMRLSPRLEDSAADIINKLPEDKLADLIFKYGEERYSRRIARAIVEARRNAPVRSSAFLASVIAKAVPPAYRFGRIHPATRSFQAIRIAVNGELEREERGLALAADLLAPGGILVVIAFHSLEDRISKHLCRDYGKTKGYDELCRSPLVPSQEECDDNPAARSAKLRALRAPGISSAPSTSRVPV
jgi:16S rRNA (cytosine1402-N4)-methyltransferase